MNIDGVSTGIVLDHIQAGKSLLIYQLLELENLDCSVAVIQNARSGKYGKKDIIKIDQLIDLDFDVLGYVDPNITVNIVKDGKMVDKKHMALPERLTTSFSARIRDASHPSNEVCRSGSVWRIRIGECIAVNTAIRST